MKEYVVGGVKFTEDEFFGRSVFRGNVRFRGVTEIPPGFNPHFTNDLDLRWVEKIPKGFNPIAGGYIDLSSVTDLPDGFSPVSGGYLDISRVKVIPKDFNPVVGGFTLLNSVEKVPYPTKIKSGRSITLLSLSDWPEWLEAKSGDCIFMHPILDATYPEGFNKSDHEHQSGLMSWRDGKYIMADGIFAEVVKHKGNVWHLKKIGSDKIFYMVTDGNGKYAHGDTLESAKADLVYKVNGDASIEDYRGISADKVLSFEESVKFYRVVTGACSWGTRNFVESNGIEQRDYTVSEIVEKTKGQYGNNRLQEFLMAA